MTNKTLAAISLLALAATASFGQRTQFVSEVATVADLDLRYPLYKSGDTEVVKVRGFYAAGDWGEPRAFLYVSNSVASTNAIVRAARGGIGRWIHSWPDGNVRAFGAKGDDTADDTIAVSNAVVMAKAQRVQLYCPYGTYKLTSTIDLRNSGDNALEFPGIRGDGLTLTKFKAYHSNAVFQIQGRGGVFERFRIEYDALRNTAATAANGIHAYGYCYYMSFRDIEIINGYRGLYVDSAANGLFSCTFDNFIARSCSYINVDVQSGSGNHWHNVYLSNPGSDAVDILFQDRAGLSQYGQFNLEHSNFRDCAIRLRGDGASFGHFHLEGLRPVTDANFIDIAGEPAEIASLSLINSYASGHVISSITSNGVVTIDTLSHAVVGGHGFRVGDTLTLAGATPTNYVGSFTVNSITSSNLIITIAGSPGVDASVNYAGGSDYIWGYIGSYPDAALFATETYGNSKIIVGGLTLRNNKILSHNSAGRTGWAMRLAREFGGKRMKLAINNITQGSQYRIGDNLIGFNPVIASSRTNNVSTAYFMYPHERQQGEYISISGGANLNFGSNYIQIASVPDKYSVTLAQTGSNAGLTAESGNMVPVKARVTNRERTSNIATLTTDVAHQLSRGSRILIRSMANSSYSDAETVVLSTPTTTNFTYLSVSTNETSTTETNGIIFEFSSGLHPSLQSSDATALTIADDYLTPLLCLPAITLAAGGSSNVVYSVNGARVGKSVNIAPITSLEPNTLISGLVASNDYVNVLLANPTAGSLTNLVTLIRIEVK